MLAIRYVRSLGPRNHRNIADSDHEDVKADNDAISVDVELYIESDEEESNNQSLNGWNLCNISPFRSSTYGAYEDNQS